MLHGRVFIMDTIFTVNCHPVSLEDSNSQKGNVTEYHFIHLKVNFILQLIHFQNSLP